MKTAMKSWGRKSIEALLVLGSVLILAPMSAHALSLGDLAAGGSITSADGSLLFDDFAVTLPETVNGKVNSLTGLDLDIFQIETFERSFGVQAFEMDGPLSALMGQAGRMVIEFRVLSIGGALIQNVGLAFAGAASGPGASVSVTQAVHYKAGNTTLFVGREAGGVQQPTDSVSLAEGQGMLMVRQDILIDSGTGFLAQISEVEQTFGSGAAPVPEPTAGALYLIGLIAFGAGTRPRNRRS